MWKFLERSNHRCAISFTNDPDKYTEDSFLEINEFFIDHQIPFADSFFFQPNHITEFSYKTHPDLIGEFIKKGRIDTLHSVPTDEYKPFKGVEVFTNHGHRGPLTDNEIGDLHFCCGIKYFSNNKWIDADYSDVPYVWRDNVCIGIDSDTFVVPDFHRYHTKFGQRKRTTNWEYFPRIYSPRRIDVMKEIGNVYFGYLHSAKYQYPFTEEAKDAVLRIANDDEIFIATTKNLIEAVINERVDRIS